MIASIPNCFSALRAPNLLRPRLLAAAAPLWGISPPPHPHGVGIRPLGERGEVLWGVGRLQHLHDEGGGPQRVREAAGRLHGVPPPSEGGGCWPAAMLAPGDVGFLTLPPDHLFPTRSICRGRGGEEGKPPSWLPFVAPVEAHPLPGPERATVSASGSGALIPICPPRRRHRAARRRPPLLRVLLTFPSLPFLDAPPNRKRA